MFWQLQKRGQPNYSDDEVRDLFEVWRDHGRGIERRVLIDRMPELLKQRDALVEQMPDMTTPEPVAAGLRVQGIANEIAESYARIQGQDRPPPTDAASWT
jgi:hypothetical protein